MSYTDKTMLALVVMNDYDSVDIIHLLWSEIF